jgi:hypothetical protein
MKQHKWYKEIKAWADGAEIEGKPKHEIDWQLTFHPWWNREDWEYRIKPQPKEFKELLVILMNSGEIKLGISGQLVPLGKGESVNKIIGRLTMELDNDTRGT